MLSSIVTCPKAVAIWERRNYLQRPTWCSIKVTVSAEGKGWWVKTYRGTSLLRSILGIATTDD